MTTNNSGRPTKYLKAYADQARKLCILGATDIQLATFFEVSESTISLWKVTHPEFSEAVKGAKIFADAQVAEALYKRALGFTYQETTFERLVTDKTADEPISTSLYKKKVVIKTVVPDAGAAMNWLSNRQKELWRNKQDVTTNGQPLNNGFEALLIKLKDKSSLDETK